MRTLLRQTIDELSKIIDDITEADLSRPTPCQGWDLRRLLAHHLGQLDGFAEAVSIGDAPPSSFERETVAADQVQTAWQRSTSALLGALEPMPDDTVIQLAGFGRQPVAMVLRIQLLDTAVHGWDVASSLGRSYRPDEAVVADILHFARQIVARPETSPAFGPPVEGAAGDDWVTALRLLGRPVDDQARWTGP